MQPIIFSVMIAFIVSIVMGPVLIPMLQKLKFGQTVRNDGPERHKTKNGTPTMGGIMMLVAITVPVAIMAKGSFEYVVLALLTTLGYGLVGFLDDFIKVKLKRSLGLRAYQKIIGQVGLALVIAVYAYNSPLIGSKLFVPFVNIEWDMGIFYIPFAVFVTVSLVNAVNLTDGLDGLASGVTLICAVAYAAIYSYSASLAASQGDMLYQVNMQNMVVFSGAVAGACLGFLRFNAFPARVFMGDTGSLALGGALSAMAILNRSMLLIPIMGGMFVASCISVILQVGSYKLRNKKRIFLMAPLHHHFELKGFPETKIVSMYMIITTILCMLSLLAYV